MKCYNTWAYQRVSVLRVLGGRVQGQVPRQVEAGRALAAGKAPKGLLPLRFGSSHAGLLAALNGTHITLHFYLYII